jgi:type IV secretion system protein VirD4
MVKVFDQDKFTRNLQNFVVILALYPLAIGMVWYLSSSATLIMILGSEKMMPLYIKFFKILATSKNLVNDIKDHTLVVYKYWIYYVKIYLTYYKNITFETYNFLLPKLIIGNVVPYTTFLVIVWKYRESIMNFEAVKKSSSVYGDAHWATEKEIKKAGLRCEDGVLMGQTDKGYLVSGGYQHILLFAPTGSGKGVGFVIPNLLFWKESVVCHDIKLENYELTSGWRTEGMKQNMYVWSPADADGFSHCYNPVDWISKKLGQMVDDVSKLANLIIPKREFWENEARTLLVGVMLYIISDKNKVQSFGQIVRELRSDDFAYNMAVGLDTLGAKIHPIGYMNLAAFLQKAEKERSGVVSTLNSGLELWGNPLIDTTTSRSDFNIQTFKKIPTTVYAGLTPDNIQRLKTLFAMFYQQATEFLSRKMPEKDEPYGVLFLMDEFPTLGKLEQFLAGIAYFRGYHVRLFLIIQDTQQLKGAYEDAGMNSFLSNATFRVTFAANNVETAKLISELVGNQTVESTSHNKPKFLDLNPASKSINISQVQRALLLPQEVISLDKDKQIILVEASSPIMTNKIKYYLDKTLTKRLLKKIPLPKQEPKIHKPIKKSAAPGGGGGSDNAALPAG